jgi:DNA replication and repair protein RecF
MPQNITSTITLNNWKSFENARFLLPQDPFVIVDKNGSGKTSMLSALYSLVSGKCWPESKFIEYLSTGKQYFGVSSDSPDFYLTGKVGLSGRVTTKWIKPPERELPAVLTYQPTDNYWLFYSRTEKIKVLDKYTALLNGDEHSEAINKLFKITKNKLSYLKHNLQENIQEPDWLLVNDLNRKIITYSDIIWKNRQRTLDLLRNNIDLLGNILDKDMSSFKLRIEFADFKGNRSLSFNPVHKIITPEQLKPLWQREVASQKVLFGAQRDDFNLLIDNLPLERYFSRGQNRSLVFFILFLISRELRQKGQKVWFLLDDIFNELDSKREDAIRKELLEEADYFIATSTRKPEGEYNCFSLRNLESLDLSIEI